MILLLHPLIGSYGSHTVGLIPCTKYIIYIVDVTWFQKDTITWSGPNMRIDLVFQHATNGNSFCVVRNNRIYLSCGSSAINTSRSSHRILMQSCDQGSCDHSIHLFSLRKFGCFLYMRRRCSFESPCLDGSFVGVLRIHRTLNKIKRIFLLTFFILRL